MEKSYYQDLFLSLLEPLKKHYSRDCAYLELGAAAAGYGSRIAGMEGFCGFCGGWYRTGPVGARMKVFCRFT